MPKERANKRIAIWAIDPDESGTLPSPRSQRQLESWLETTSTIIQPAYVLHVSSPNDLENGTHALRDSLTTQRKLTEYLGNLAVPGVLEPKILVDRSGGPAAAAKVLAQYAQDLKASWILVSSKGRSGLSRLAHGSFAESLLHSSCTPIWALEHLAPKDERPSQIKHIAFATDFSDQSRLAFDEIVAEAARNQAQLTLVHFISPPVYLTAPPTENYLNNQLAWAHGIAKKWTSASQKMEVKLDSIIRTTTEQIPESIIREAHDCGADVIALASQSGPRAAAILGSTARQLIRQSTFPVWVLGPTCLEALRKNCTEFEEDEFPLGRTP